MSFTWAGLAPAAVLAIAFAVAPAPARAEIPPELLEDWYRVELLVFLREDDASLASEGWDPLPELHYPEDYRHLIDPELADRRLRESGAYASVIDERGTQYLLLPAPFSTVEAQDRPDVLINQPWEDPAEDPLPDGTGADPGSETVDAPPPGQAAEGADASGQPEPSDDASADEAPPVRLRVLPFELLDSSALEFTAQARSLRRRGERVLFHGAWWQYLPEDHAPRPIALDRGADSDLALWPELQGSVLVYRSRYLHIDVDLWLNTLGSYLPEGWQIDAPPLPDPTLAGETLAGEIYDPWAPAALLTDPSFGDSLAAPVEGVAPRTSAEPRAPEDHDRPQEENPGDGDATDDPVAAPYPWHHAIVHRQTRRMRSDEIHYLDHPVIGVVVRLRPASEALSPFAADEERAFRERHGLPIVEVNPEASPPGSD